MNDELRDQIRGLDPMHPGVPTEPVTTESSRELLENIMSTPVKEQEKPEPAPQRSLRPWYALAAAMLVAVVAVGGIVLFTGDDATIDPVASEPLELGLGDGPGLASCLPVSAEILRDMPVAFLGTATAVDGEQVTLNVDRWYAGGDAESVILTAPAGFEALIGGIDFQVGERYFVAATNEVVNYCGYSDVYSAELERVYQDAFGA